MIITGLILSAVWYNGRNHESQCSIPGATVLF